MRSNKSGLVAFAFTGLLVSAGIVACSADGGSADLGTDSPATDPTTGGAVLPPPSNNSSSGDPGTPAKDAGTKPKTDAGVDAGPPPPSPGDACTKADAIATRPCGACGTQQALCQAAAGDGGALTWSDYGVCQGELAGGCIPGTTVTEACGNCGTVVKTCNKYCAYTSGACTGQPANSCAPNSVDYTTAGCSTPNTYKNRTCGSTCTWSNFSGTCAAPNNPNKMALSANPAVGNIVTQQWTLSAASVGNRPTDCSAGSVYSDPVQRIAVEIDNPSSKKATVSIYQTKVTTDLDLYMWYYSNTLPPMDDNALVTCVDTTDGCSGTVPTNLCSTSPSYNLAGFSNIVIPPGGAVLVYSSGYSASVTGAFNLNVKVDALQ